MRYCGRTFTEKEVAWVQHEVEAEPRINRRQLSIRFCEQFDWRKPDGELKDMSCRVAFLKMSREGLLRLPEPKNGYNGHRPKVQRTLFGEPKPDLNVPAGKLDLQMEMTDKASLSLWNELVDRYHYLGYKPLPGAQLRYFVQSQIGTVALLGFSAAAWKTAPRDQYIGWDPSTQKQNLKLVVNNSRFLILPWIRSKYLASRVLARATRRLADDWEARYNYRPMLVETFVQKDKYKGTSYKAAGWTCVGETQGRGKLDAHHRKAVPVKTVWLHPLQKDFRKHLLESES